MGVNRTDYVMLGVKFDFKEMRERDPDCEIFEEYRDNGYKDKVTSHNDITLIEDGMCGKYAIAGKVLDKSTESGMGLKMCTYEASKKEKKEIEKLVEKHIGIKGDAKIYVFTHWH